MPYVVKHKINDRYLCGTRSQKADHDPHGLVSIDFARIFPTEAGAKTAIRAWAKRYDGLAIDQKKMERLQRRAPELTMAQLEPICRGSVVLDQDKVDMVEIVPVRIG